MSNIRWRGNEVMASLQRGLANNIERACVHLERDIKKSFPDTGKGGMSTKKERAASRSKPGEIPHVDTGTLRRGVDHQVILGTLLRPTVGRVGLMRALIGKNKDMAEAIIYGPYLEIGTSKMEKRPYLRPAIPRNRVQLRRILRMRVWV